MSVAFVDTNRNVLDDADATTGWSGDNSAELFTADPDPVELSGCLGIDVGTANEYMEFTITSDDYSLGGSLFVWMQANGTMDDTEGTGTAGGIQIVIGDGTNIVGYHVGGSDKAGFRHSEGPVSWQCFILDPRNKPEFNTVYAGSEASLDLTAITEVGIAFTTLSKALGGAANCFWDIIRWADLGDAVVLRGGATAGAAGNGDDAATGDRSDSSLRAHGVFRELAVGVYGIQGNITIGNSASATDQFWSESNVTYAWEDRGLSPVNYYRFALVGRTGQTSEISFAATTFTVPAAADAHFDGNGADLDVCTLDACTLIGFNVGVEASDDTGDAWTNCNFIGNGTVVANGCDLSGSSFSDWIPSTIVESQTHGDYQDVPTSEGTFAGGTGYAVSDTITMSDGSLITVDALGASDVLNFTVTTAGAGPVKVDVVLTQISTSGSGTGFSMTPDVDNLQTRAVLAYNLAVDPDGELDNLTIEKTSTFAHHAIEFGADIPSTITLTGCDFGTDFSATEDTSVGDETFHFLDTTGSITLNLVGCTGNFGYQTDGATISIETSVPVTLTFLDNTTGDPIEGVSVVLGTGPGLVDVIDNQLSNASGVISVSYSGTTPDVVEGFAAKGSEAQTYKRAAIGGTIASGTGLIATIRLVRD